MLDESLDLTPSAQPQGETEGDNMEVTAGRSSLLPVNNGEEQVDYDEVSYPFAVLSLPHEMCNINSSFSCLL